MHQEELSYTAHCYLQGELEHRSPKARFSRTNHKHFIKQLTQIERRQARLRRIRARHKEAGRPTHEEVPISLNAHHVIGKSQNYPEHIPSFLQNNASDPAVKVNMIPYVLVTLNDDGIGLYTKPQKSYPSTH